VFCVLNYISFVVFIFFFCLILYFLIIYDNHSLLLRKFSHLVISLPFFLHLLAIINRWNIIEIAQSNGWHHQGSVVFDKYLYPGYTNRKALHQKSFPSNDALVTTAFILQSLHHQAICIFIDSLFNEKYAFQFLPLITLL
jgi:hypothetical protein